ncbi:MAG: cobyric acid synthase [Desulfofustis sp.]|nr:cobyric acid synthase [Desulfofustis sp.]
MTELHKFEHGGNVHGLSAEIDAAVLDFSANINPLGPPAWLRSLINRDLHLIAHYPDPKCEELVRGIAERYKVDRRMIVPANGTTELLYLLPTLIERRKLIIPVPCYVDYLKVFEIHGFDIQFLRAESGQDPSLTIERLERALGGGEAVIFGNPVNPIGSMIEDAKIIDFANRFPDSLLIVDEAFHDFIVPFNTVGGQAANIISLNSLTKFFAIPGLRAGFGIFPEPYRRRLESRLPPWSVNVLSQRVALKCLEDSDYCQKTVANCSHLRQQLKEGLSGFTQLKVFDSQANYLLLKLGRGLTGETLYRQLLDHGIVIRRCSNYPGLGDNFVRVAVRTRAENDRLIEAFNMVLNSLPKSTKPGSPKACTIMFQGTSSNAGKSIMSAALCRILVQDGYRVSPFKAQNMSLNSHVTADGGEMGRAQVVQAQAAKLEPDWRMNPVLLKPNSDTGSQVIVNGKPVRNMNVRQYHDFKDQAWDAAKLSFDELRSEYDVIVLEGAGSPGEVNLKRHDFVNMKMARHAEAPVLLVGDIDRGGVYASFAGIMDVLEEWERSLVAGFVVNKFRGDQSLLEDAHRFVYDHTGIRVLGVVPYITDMAIPQEDSVSLREGFYRDRGTGPDQVEIVVIDIPHISNFTDIDPLYHELDVNVRFASDRHLIGKPDAIILPGSKNVAGDLRHIRERGMDQVIVDYARQGGTVVGICGGYQMLGRELRDPHSIETSDGTIEGLGLLEVDTVLAPEKTLVKQRGIHLESGEKIVGYEIHHGKTSGNRHPVLQFENGMTCGSRTADRRIWGAYLHGIFDRDKFRRWFIDLLRVQKNLAPKGKEGASYNVDKSLDELAELVRSSIDVEKIYQLMNLEP